MTIVERLIFGRKLSANLIWLNLHLLFTLSSISVRAASPAKNILGADFFSEKSPFRRAFFRTLRSRSTAPHFLERQRTLGAPRS